MNLLSLLSHDYIPDLSFNKETVYWELRLICHRINDTDVYDQLTKDDLCVLRENAKRIYEALALYPYYPSL